MCCILIKDFLFSTDLKHLENTNTALQNLHATVTELGIIIKKCQT